MYGKLNKKIGGEKPTPSESVLSVDFSEYKTLVYRNAVTWSEARNATDATDADIPRPATTITSNFAGTSFELQRALFLFDLTGVIQDITTCELNYTKNSGDRDIVALASTITSTPTLADYDNFTTLLSDNNNQGVETNKLIFNASGIAYINANKGSVIGICLRDKQYDYLDVQFPSNTYLINSLNESLPITLDFTY